MIRRGLISCIVVFALAFIGFGHRALTPAVDTQATAYVLAGGDWADICGQTGDPRHARVDQCLACIVSHGCLTPTPAQFPALQLATSALWIGKSASISRLSILDWAYAARAPPLA